MVLILELSRHIEWRPWFFESRLMYRIGWLWFAIAWLRVPYEEYALTPTDFILLDGRRIRSLGELARAEEAGKKAHR
jgi:hypothetical protein